MKGKLFLRVWLLLFAAILLVSSVVRLFTAQRK